MKKKPLIFAVMLAGGLFSTACSDLLGCSGDYLFQDWTESSYQSADGGTVTIAPATDGGTDGGAQGPYLDLSAAHYGAGQSFYMGGCSYLVDIEEDDTGEAGTFSFSNPTPNSPGCIANETTETFSLSCSSLLVSSPRGTATYSPPAD